MALRRPHQTRPVESDDVPEVSALDDETIISIPDRDDPTRWRHFYTEEDADAYTGREGIERALAAAGAWSDLEYDEMLDALDRIRHSSVPTPPIEFDWDEDERGAISSTRLR